MSLKLLAELLKTLIKEKECPKGLPFLMRASPTDEEAEPSGNLLRNQSIGLTLIGRPVASAAPKSDEKTATVHLSKDENTPLNE